MNIWEAIRDGANDVERLIGQKQYNLAMVKARQTLEIMVRALAENNGIQVTDMAATIDELSRYRIISSTTAEHYHKIRMIGNKAAHEGDENPSGANTAYHLLSQELYTFAKDFSSGSSTIRRARTGTGYSDTGARSGASSTRGGSNGTGSTRPARSREIDEHSVRRVSHRTSRKSSITPELIFKVMIPILVLVLIFGIVALVKKKDTEKEVETEQQLQIVVETTAPETEPVTTVPETEPETVTVYTVNTAVLNVRSQPTKDSEKLGQVHEGETLSFISDYDSEWALINYNDQEGYVNKQYVNARSMDLAQFAAEAAAAEAEGDAGAQGGEAADAQ